VTIRVHDVVLNVDVPPALVKGGVDDGYGRVADAFRRNFTGAARSARPARSIAMGARSSISGAATATA
jgi:hypothetical protein